MRSCVAVTLLFVALINAAVCKEENKVVTEDRLRTDLSFYEALTRAKKIVDEIGGMSQVKRSEWCRAEKFVLIPGISSRMGFGSVKDGLYTYIWAQDPSGTCQIFGEVVEFYSGGLWFQVTSKGIYRFDPSTKLFTELSPQMESSEYPFLDTLPFIEREFIISKPVHKIEAAE